MAHADGDNPNNAPFALHGMPISYVIAPSGQVVGYLAGAADWASDAARNLLDYVRRSRRRVGAGR